MTGSWDVVIVHDPQPAALRGFATGHRGRWIWRCLDQLQLLHEVAR